MNKSPRDRAYEASEALERAADKLRNQLDDLELVLLSLRVEVDTLERIGERVGGTPGQVCKRAAHRLSMDEEVEMLNAVRSRISQETVELIGDADEALQIRLPFSGEFDVTSTQ
ncbi:MAG: hypothetical protein F4010_00105 [Cenarchaeum sp. SB0669_bin_11]|nr:hypothetical protein [Gammaproteobacteria bacterium]MYL10568.1 hypothetical protein [Cenarchaeum sp. SB0669_bin_11]